MEINPTWKSSLLVSWLYLMSSAFTLAKTLRDAHEVQQLERAQDLSQRAVMVASETATARGIKFAGSNN